MKRIAAFVLVLGIAGVALGQNPQRLTPPEQRFNCKILQVSADQKQLTCLQGAFQQSGIGGETEKAQPINTSAKRYTVSITEKTDIHWQDSFKNGNVRTGEKLTPDQLQRMSNQRITIPMTIYYPANASLDESQPVIATEIVLLGSPQQSPLNPPDK
jgi:hypothetical protein